MNWNIFDPSNAGLLAIVVIVAQAVGKIIPDGSGGVLGFIRAIAKMIGLYVENRK